MIQYPSRLAFAETHNLDLAQEKSSNLFSLENRNYLFNAIKDYPLTLNCQPTVCAKEEIDEAVKDSLKITTIIAETSNYQLDLAIDDLIVSKFRHADISTLKRIRDSIKKFSFNPELNLTLENNLTPNLVEDIQISLFDNQDESSIIDFKKHVIESFKTEGYDVADITSDQARRLLKLCSEKAEEHNFDKIYQKITKINSLLKSIPGQESNPEINFANVFRLIVWFDEFKKSKDPNNESKLRVIINKLFRINIENIYNIFYELNGSKKSHLIEVFKIGLYNQSLEFKKAWNLVDNENIDLVEKCIYAEDLHNLNFNRLVELASSSEMLDEISELKVEYLANHDPQKKIEILNRLSDLAAIGKLKEHFKKALDVIVKIFCINGASQEDSYSAFLDEYQELKGSLLPERFADGKYDFFSCSVFKKGTTFNQSIDYLVNFVKRKTLQVITHDSEHNSMEYFWKSNNLIHLILYIMHKNVLMKSLYHEKEVECARTSFIAEFQSQEEFVDFGENQKGVHILGVNIDLYGEKIPCILQIPQIKSLESAIRKSLRKNTPPNQIFDMLRIRISLPLNVEQDKTKLDKCFEIITSYFMNKFGNTTFGETKYTITGAGFRDSSLGFKNLKLVLRYQFTHDKRADFLEKLKESQILASLEEHSTVMKLQIINKITELLSLDEEQIANLQEVDFGISCSEIQGEILAEILACFDQVVKNDDNFIKVELQIVPTETTTDEVDDHQEYSEKQMGSIKKMFLPSLKDGLINAINFLTFNKFDNICEIPGLNEIQTKNIYIQMFEFMVTLICEKIDDTEFYSVFSDPLYRTQIKSNLERFLSETHLINRSGIELVTDNYEFQSKIITLIGRFTV